jgi:hypothetical protein
MNTLENIYTFKTRNFTIRVDAMEETDPDFSFDDTGETQEMIERGDWLCFAVRASVSFRGSDIGEDYLGNCIHENIRDFRDNIGVVRGSYFSDMVRNVIREARKTLSEMPKLRQTI